MQASSSSIWYEACLQLVSRLYIRQLHCLHYYEFVGNKRQYFAIVMMISVHIAILPTSRWFVTSCTTSAWECHTSEDCSVLDKCADKECGCHSKNPLLKEIFFRRRPIRLICIFCRQPLRTRVRHCKWLHWDWSPLLLHWWLLLYLWTIYLFLWERPSYNWPQVTTFSGAFPWWWDAENYRNYDSTSGEMGTLRR